MPRSPVSSDGTKKRYMVEAPSPVVKPCQECNGQGEILAAFPCKKCNGTGKKETRSVEWRYLTDDQADNLREFGYILQHK